MNKRSCMIKCLSPFLVSCIYNIIQKGICNNKKALVLYSVVVFKGRHSQRAINKEYTDKSNGTVLFVNVRRLAVGSKPADL